MAEIRFLHAADIHLDSPMRGLEAEPDAPVRVLRGASRTAFVNLIDTAIAEQVSFVLIAGDLYDGDWPDWRTGLFLIEQAARLTQAGIPLVMIAGNHDAASVITRHLRLPAGATLLPPEHCGRVVIENVGVAIHGRSFPTKAVTEDLTAGYPASVPGLFNIGLLHTALAGRLGHEPYAPTTVETLIAKGYDYWALGHVHNREEVHRNPWIVFPGNLQGRQIREAGPKGATLVTVRDGRVTLVEHRALDAVRWCRLEVAVSGISDVDDAMARVGTGIATHLTAAEGRPIAVRIILTGATRLHGKLLGEPEAIRQGVIAEGRHYGTDRVWIESVVIDTSPATDLADRPDIVGALSRALDELVRNPTSELLGDYPGRLRERLRDLDLPDDHPLRNGDGIAPILRAARDLILARLDGEG